MTDTPRRARRGDWLQTHSGIRFYPADPRPEDIQIEDIAWALARLCRFNGHCSRLYTVAEHSILVARHVWQNTANKPNRKCLTRTALLHDASEAYLGDVVRPLKRMPQMAAYRDMETAVEFAIANRFDLSFPLPGIVKHHDERALMTERRDLVPNAHLSGWTGNVVPPFEETLPAEAPPPARVYAEFLNIFRNNAGGQ